MSETTKALHNAFEPHPDPQNLTANVSKDVDYEPYPEKSVDTTPEHRAIMKQIINLYSGSASEEDMQVYAHNAIYDDPYSYCDTRYKIAGQCKLQTLKTEVVSDKPDEIVFKMRHEYTVRGIHLSKAVDSLISLGLDKNGKVRYHKDMWNEKDYSHEGLGKVLKTLNGDHLTKITQPPETL